MLQRSTLAEVNALHAPRINIYYRQALNCAGNDDVFFPGVVVLPHTQNINTAPAVHVILLIQPGVRISCCACSYCSTLFNGKYRAVVGWTILRNTCPSTLASLIPLRFEIPCPLLGASDIHFRYDDVAITVVAVIANKVAHRVAKPIARGFHFSQRCSRISRRCHQRSSRQGNKACKHARQQPLKAYSEQFPSMLQPDHLLPEKESRPEPTERPSVLMRYLIRIQRELVLPRLYI